ncbi:MAG TPA: NAD(P)/FAD-dependent oxidoreductase [Dermatophilaceae bacterium]|nr:NAD(P)/FAD-dependent oxidoreductase [Dermatophilaceae bacterium]
MPHVVVIGSGFGGLFATQALASAPVRITVVAKTTHHLFQPLLYQVATGILSEGEIAPTTREILKRQRNARVIVGLVLDVDLTVKTVTSRYHERETVTGYDWLIVAAGAGQSYFGNDHFATFAPGMKTIDDALELRSRIFGAFERAELEPDPAERERLLTFTVVGAGPTGVEMAGQIRELSTHTLRRDFRALDPTCARIILIDGGAQVLPAFGHQLGAKTHRSLTDMGVEVRLNAMVTDLDADGLTLTHRGGSTERIGSECKVWAAGVAGSELGATLAGQSGAELDRNGRIVVQSDLTLPDHPEVFVIGDMAAVPGVPGVAQGAIQGARYAARRILDPAADSPFRYVDKGSMATISRFRAVVSVGRLRVTGFPAWLMWLGLHLLYITGFKHRVTTLLHWAISFIGNARSERVTTNQQLVGRLAMERLGQHVSGPLLQGVDVEPVAERPRRVP